MMSDPSQSSPQRPDGDSASTPHVEAPAKTGTRIPPSEARGDELPPDLLGRLRISIPGYRLLSVIGRGGQAIVFKAVQESTGKTVAVKLLKGGPITSPSTRERFDREVRALAAIDHPNIVGIIDTGQTRHGHGYLVMNYIAGQSLKQLMEDAKLAPIFGLEPAAMLRLFKKICDAVNAAHMKGITHRDLSPSNVIVDEQGEPHIVDFGLARTAFDRFMNVDRREVTVTGQFLGKIAYASPEQAQGKSDQIDIRTDVYALGVILYQLLTEGRFPYEVVGNIADVLHNIVSVKPTPPSQVNSVTAPPNKRASPRLRGDSKTVVNPVIEAIVLKALEKNPADRYRSAGELGIDIENYLGGQPTTARIAKTSVTKSHRERSRYAAAIVLLAIGIAGGAYWWRRPAQLPESRSAITASDRASGAPGEKTAASKQALPHISKQDDDEAQASADAERGAVNLLSNVNLKVATIKGKWESIAGVGIQSDEVGPVKLRLSPLPRGEYNAYFRFKPIQYTLRGTTKIHFGLWYNGTRFGWAIGTRINGGACGFGTINGTPYYSNRSASEVKFEANLEYGVEIRVRKNELKAFVNGALMNAYETDYSDLTKLYTDPGNDLEICTQDCAAVFTSAKIVPLSDSGGKDRESVVKKNGLKNSSPRNETVNAAEQANVSKGALSNEAQLAPKRPVSNDDNSIKAEIDRSSLPQGQTPSARLLLGEPIRRRSNAPQESASCPGEIDYGSRSNGNSTEPILLGKPPDGEYDWTVTFAPTKANAVGLIANYKGRSFVWWVGHKNNTTAGIELVNGHRYFDNNTAVVRPSWLVRDQECTVVIHVRENFLTIDFDGQQVFRRSTDFSEFSLPERLKAVEGQLGVVAYSPTQFRSIKAYPVQPTKPVQRRKKS